jgi:filamentous hemagglutinin family protein
VKTKSLYVIASSLFISNIAFALPSGGSVSAGSATISQTNSQTTINQTTQNAVINWNGFDTSSNESVVFNQPNSTSNTLNRINSGLPTNFAGSLTANGNVFIVNSSGIVFAKGSKVDVAGLVATTLDVNNDDFMNGHNKFTLPQGSENSSVINNGTLTAEDQGVIALIAPNVSNGNSGIIQAHIGSVVLATGRTFVIDFANDQLINFDSSSLIKNGHIESSGIISANGGRILMTNNAISQTLDNVISVSGTVEANAAYNGFHHEIILTNTNNAINVSGNVSSSKVELNAGSGITISGAIKSNDNFVAKTTEGNIAVNGSIDTDNVSGNVALTANDGAIIESDSGEIIADTLSTNSSKGTILNSAHNNAYVF